MKLRVHGHEFVVDETRLDATLAEVRRQVTAYERGDREAFDLGVQFPEGLLGEVLRAMVTIPYGETRTYGELAAQLDSSPVAVGQACGRNPVPVVVPCHRVVGHDSLGGFSSPGGLAAKRALLDAEAGQRRLDGWQD